MSAASPPPVSWRDYASLLTAEQKRDLAAAEATAEASELAQTAQEYALANDFQRACNDGYSGALSGDVAYLSPWVRPATPRGQTCREVIFARWRLRGAAPVDVEVVFEETLDGSYATRPSVRVDLGGREFADLDTATARRLAAALGEAACCVDALEHV